MCTPSLCLPGENVLIIEESFPGETEEIVASEISLSSIHLAVQRFVSVSSVSQKIDNGVKIFLFTFNIFLWIKTRENLIRWFSYLSTWKPVKQVISITVKILFIVLTEKYQI